MSTSWERMQPILDELLALSRDEREAAVASRLDHPGICTVYEVGEDQGKPWIAMQLVEGESLAVRLGRRRDGAVREEAVRALHVAHEAGIALDGFRHRTSGVRYSVPLQPRAAK